MLKKIPEITKDPQKAADEAGLIYVNDFQPGIRRKRKGKSFEFVNVDGKKIRDEKILARIKSLVIPPAWTDVWICANSNGHLQATGRDSRNRKQYRYHPKWRSFRDQTKYDRMLAFGLVLPKLRTQVEKDLALPGLPREKVLATIIRTMEKTLIRVGNDEYSKQNNSYGLTTLRNKHVKVKGDKVFFNFKGKSGVIQKIEMQSPRLSKIIKRCSDLPGHELFGYIDENGKVIDIGSTDVNTYLKNLTGEDFTAKDFRTWHGTVLAYQFLKEIGEFKTQKEAKSNLVQMVEKVSQNLGNTRAVCRKCYIHPAVIDSYMNPHYFNIFPQEQPKVSLKIPSGLKPQEQELMKFLSMVILNP